jgi:hypothetical protein
LYLPGELDRVNKAILAINQALAAPVQEPDAYGYARRLAVAIWEQHYKATAPQWKPLDDLIGVLTQIDNMTSGLTTAAQRKPLTEEQIDEVYGEASVQWQHIPHEDVVRIVRATEAAHGIKEKNT